MGTKKGRQEVVMVLDMRKIEIERCIWVVLMSIYHKEPKPLSTLIRYRNEIPAFNPLKSLQQSVANTSQLSHP